MGLPSLGFRKKERLSLPSSAVSPSPRYRILVPSKIFKYFFYLFVLQFHASGMDKKIPKLDTPEEIEKYRNERKK